MLSSALFTCNLPFPSPYPSVFLCLFCPKSLRSIPFPHLHCSLKHPITRPAQTPNALPLHPQTPPMPTGRHKPPLPCRCPHTWALGLRVCQEGPGQGVPSSEPLKWVPTCSLPPPDSCRWDTHGLVAPGRDPTGCYLGSPSHQCLPVLLCRWAEELYCISRQWGEFLSPGTGFN